MLLSDPGTRRSTSRPAAEELFTLHTTYSGSEPGDNYIRLFFSEKIETLVSNCEGYIDLIN